ncbi:MAG: hypothetical protein NTZ73_03425 [Candidatus Diapherotrites archaeon]|nr:hypothetical protein [Candidatus Diapherotrites archaeon]
MKKVCPDCKVPFEVDFEEFGEGDAVTCPECNLEFTIICKEPGKFKLIESKALEMEEMEEESGEDNEDYEYDED